MDALACTIIPVYVASKTVPLILTPLNTVDVEQSCHIWHSLTPNLNWAEVVPQKKLFQKEYD
jgi:hypothetical protein